MIDNPRLRLVLGRHGLRIAAVLVVVAAGAILFSGWIAMNPPTETVTQQAHQQEVVTTGSTSAVVVENGTLWPEGTVLRDSPVYLVNATPTLNVTAETRIRGTDDARIRHEWGLTVLARSEEETFWTENETLATATHRNATARTNATVDVPALMRQVARAQEQVDGAGTVAVLLTLTVDYDTGRYADTVTMSAPLDLRESSYAVDGEFRARTNHSTTVQTRVTRPPDRTRTMGLFAFGLVTLAVAAGIVTQRPDEIDPEKAKLDIDRRRYAQWISPGIIPDGLDQTFLQVNSLEDVVDVAIDTNERVIHDTRRDLFAVIGDNVVYYYCMEGSWEETFFPSFGFSRETPEPETGPFAGAGAGGGTETTEGEFREAFGLDENGEPDDGDRGHDDLFEDGDTETPFDAGGVAESVENAWETDAPDGEGSADDASDDAGPADDAPDESPGENALRDLFDDDDEGGDDENER